MSPIEKCLAALRNLGCDPRPTRDGQWSANCCGHDDTNPSLSVSVGRDGRVLLFCFAGCPFERLVAALGLKPSDLAPERAAAPPAPRKPRVTEYAIRGTNGAIEAWHIRTDFADRPKKMRWRSPGDPTGLGGRGAETLPLYGFERLHDIPDGTRVYVTEGEKAADALLDRGFLAFGTVTGSSGTPSADVLRQLARLDVILWPDNDAGGIGHMARIGAVLVAAGGKARILSWPDARPKDDAFDFFAHGGTDEQLDALVGDAKPADAVAPPVNDGRRPAVVCLADVEPRAVEYLWPTYIPRGKLTLLDGDPEVGKTFLAIAIATAVTLGRPLPGDDA